MRNLRCTPYLKNIDEIKQFLEFFIDDQFVKLEKIKVQKLQPKRNHQYLVPVEIHPVIPLLDTINYLISKNPETIDGEYENSLSDLLNLALVTQQILKICNNDLNKLGTPEYIQELKSRFKTIDGFRKIIYEMQMASVSSFLGRKPTFSIEKTKRWPDLRVDNGKSAYIECKKLDGPEHIYQRHLLVKINQLFTKLNKNVRVDIVLENFPDLPEDLDKIPLMVEQMLQSNETEKIIESGKISIYEYQQSDFTENGIRFGEDTDFDHMTSEIQFRNLNGKKEFKNPRAITIKCKEIPFPENSIKKQLGNAYGQLKTISDENYKILSIDIAEFVDYLIVKKNQEYEKIIQASIDYIKGIFVKGLYSKLSGVILTWNLTTTQQGIVQSQFKTHVISNHNSSSPLPEKYLDVL